MDNMSLKQLKTQVDDHIVRTNERFVQGEGRMDELISISTNNSKSINKLSGQIGKLTTNICELEESTSGMVQLWRDAQGAIRIGSLVKKFLIIVISIPIVGECYKWAMEFLQDKGFFS